MDATNTNTTTATADQTKQTTKFSSCSSNR